MSDTRLVPGLSADTLRIRRARIRVTRGADKGKELVLDGIAPTIIGTALEIEFPLRDDTISSRHFELKPTPLGYLVRDLDSTNGIRVGGVKILEALLEKRTTLVCGQTEIDFQLLSDDVEVALSHRRAFGAMLGEAPAMRSLFATLERVAPSEMTVLLEGESGTGKEGLAEAIHRGSPRADGPFVVVDCGALTATLIESELFGHEKGAFTGADSARTGAFETAHGGTLFLDELGELPIDLQPRLLRAIEARQVRRVGSDKYRPVDVRLIAATNRKLSRLVADGKFREDLLHRLSVVSLVVPPLRNRREDILPLARHLLSQFRPDLDPDEVLGPAVRGALQSYSWPGNVRQLRNAIERLIAIGELGSSVRDRPTEGTVATFSTARREAIDRFERDYCLRLLEETKGIVTHAAEKADLSRQMLHRLLRRHGIGKDDA